MFCLDCSCLQLANPRSHVFMTHLTHDGFLLFHLLLSCYGSPLTPSTLQPLAPMFLLFSYWLSASSPIRDNLGASIASLGSTCGLSIWGNQVFRFCNLNRWPAVILVPGVPTPTSYLHGHQVLIWYTLYRQNTHTQKIKKSLKKEIEKQQCRDNLFSSFFFSLLLLLLLGGLLLLLRWGLR